MKLDLKRISWLLMGAALAASPLACGDDEGGGGDGGTDSGSDTDTDADASTDTDTDTDSDADLGGTFECWEGVALGEGGTSIYQAGMNSGVDIAQHIWQDAPDPTYQLYVDSWGGSYGGPSEPGTYPIEAKDTNWSECGLCIRLFEWSGGSITRAYMPVEGSGSVTIDSIALGADGVGTVFAGSYDLELREVSTTNLTTPVSGGCVGPSQYAWSGEMERIPEIPAVGQPIEDLTITGFADADLSNLIDTAEQTDVEFGFTSIFADTGKKSLVVLLGREL
jgi:hypothetical protein